MSLISHFNMNIFLMITVLLKAGISVYFIGQRNESLKVNTVKVLCCSFIKGPVYKFGEKVHILKTTSPK